MSIEERWLAGHMGNRANPYQQALQRVAGIVREEGRMEILHSGAAGDEASMLSRLRENTLQAMVGTAACLHPFCSEVSLCDFPFLFSSREHFYRSCDEVLRPVLTQRLLEKDIRLLCIMEGGWRDIFNSRRPITEPDDLSGLRMRTMDNPVHQATMTALGAEAVVLSTAESYEALKNGDIDGGDRAASNYVDYGYHRIAPYYCKIGVFMIASYLLVSEKWFRSLGEQSRQLLLTMSGEIAATERRDYREADEAALAALEKESVTITHGNRAAFRRATEKVWSQFLPATRGADLLEKIQRLDV